MDRITICELDEWLRAMGLDARYLVDGFAAWRESGRPVVPIERTEGALP